MVSLIKDAELVFFKMFYPTFLVDFFYIQGNVSGFNDFQSQLSKSFSLALSITLLDFNKDLWKIVDASYFFKK